MSEDDGKLRLDKWLWAARFFKTRRLAVEALEAGKVLANGQRAKPAKAVAVGDRLDIRTAQQRFEVEVLGLSARRGPAPEAQQLYRETEASRAQREAIAAARRTQPQPAFKGRPTKRDRREIEKFRGGGGGSVW